MPHPRIRELGYGPGYYQPGPKNSVFDVKGLQLGQKTIHDAERGIHVGVTVIFPRGVEDTRRKPSYAAIHTLNGAGEMTGKHFIDEWGFTNSPIAFTDSMSLGSVFQSLVKHAWDTSRSLGEDEDVGYSHFGFPVVGETWGGTITDIHDGKSTLSHEQVMQAVRDADSRVEVGEGSQGGGAGMICQGHKGGTGTSSRKVPGADGDEYTVGVLVQTNYGHKSTLQIGGVPVGKLLLRDEIQKQEDASTSATPPRRGKYETEGSIIIASITDAPLLPHQLRRLALRATFGLAAVGGHGTSHDTSGDIFIAMSTSNECQPEVLMKHEWSRTTNEAAAHLGGRPAGNPGETSGNGFRRLVETQTIKTVVHSSIDALFVATSEATEEAILNSLCAGEDILGWDGTVWKGLDCDRVMELLQKYRVE